ncbi:MAG: hypothetical protein HZA79_13665 [Sphingobacteriales bacterium]|nr:hypothetical protein [Sphingobacteriales bacterium]
MNREDLTYRLWVIVIILTGGLLFNSCSGKDKKTAVIPEAGALYFDCQVNAEEGDDKLTVLLRFRNGEEGMPLTLPAGADVYLDGEKLMPDSSRLTGSFYELHKPIEEFEGSHKILLQDKGRKMYEQGFEFYPMGLVAGLPDTVEREDLELGLTGLHEEDYVRVIATDTLFSSEGINRLDTVREGRLVIRAGDFSTLVSGPVQLLLLREFETPLKTGSGAAGKLSISYLLRREFFLRD